MEKTDIANLLKSEKASYPDVEILLDRYTTYGAVQYICLLRSSDKQLSYLIYSIAEDGKKKILTLRFQSTIDDVQPVTIPRRYLDSLLVACELSNTQINRSRILSNIFTLSHQVPLVILYGQSMIDSEELHTYGITNLLQGRTFSSDESTHKDSYIGITGTLMNPPIPKRQVSVLAIMTVFNEEDIIEQTAQKLLSQGINLHIIDNHSTDKTPTIISSLKLRFPHTVFSSVYPVNQKDNSFHLAGLLSEVERIAQSSSHEWIIHHDADEIRTSAWPHISLRDGLSIVDHAGYNAINHTVLNFYPTKDGFNKTDDPETFFSYFQFGSDYSDLLQIKAWKNQKKNKIILAQNGGHQVCFKDRRVFPLNFLLKHYSWRSSAQLTKKLLLDRILRLNNAEVKKGWHSHYTLFSFLSLYNQFPFSKSSLIHFSKTLFTEYIVELYGGTSLLLDPYKKLYIQKLQHLESQLDQIYSSRFFKLWQLFNRVKKKIQSLK